MKRLVFILSLLFLIQVSAASIGPGITVENVEPTPIQPGDTVKMHVKVYNTGPDTASFKPLKVETTEGISFTGTTSNLAGSFELCDGCKESGVLYFQVGENVKTGNYPIELNVTSESGIETVKEYELNVDGSPNLIVDLEAMNLAPGETETGSIRIENIGTGKATQITLKTSSKLFKLEPSTLSIGDLGPGEQKVQEINITADKEIKSGIKTFNTVLTFKDDNKKVQEPVELKTLIKQEADVVISDFNPGKTVIGKTTVLTLEIENLGPGEAEQIVSKLSCEGAKVSSKKSFVGVLGEEESVPLAFTVIPQKKNIKCTTNVEYKDSSQNSFSESFDFSASEKNSIVAPVLLAIGLIFLAVFIWRKRRQNELEEV